MIIDCKIYYDFLSFSYLSEKDDNFLQLVFKLFFFYYKVSIIKIPFSIVFLRTHRNTKLSNDFYMDTKKALKIFMNF